MKARQPCSSRLLLCLFIIGLSSLREGFAGEKPNVLLIICDDLNDYVETLGGHSRQRATQNRSLEAGFLFTAESYVRPA